MIWESRRRGENKLNLAYLPLPPMSGGAVAKLPAHEQPVAVRAVAAALVQHGVAALAAEALRDGLRVGRAVATGPRIERLALARKVRLERDLRGQHAAVVHDAAEDLELGGPGVQSEKEGGLGGADPIENRLPRRGVPSAAVAAHRADALAMERGANRNLVWGPEVWPGIAVEGVDFASRKILENMLLEVPVVYRADRDYSTVRRKLCKAHKSAGFRFLDSIAVIFQISALISNKARRIEWISSLKTVY